MFLDIAFGLALGKYFSINYFQNDPAIIALGVVFALLPDLDFIAEYFYNKYKKEFLKKFIHRGIIHTPALYIFIATFFALLNFNQQIIHMFLIGTLYHLFHDLFVLGRGVMIFYPLSSSRLKVFPDNGSDGYLKEKLIWWNEDKMSVYKFENINSLHSENWVKVWYLRPNLFLFAELLLTIVFTIMIFALI